MVTLAEPVALVRLVGELAEHPVADPLDALKHLQSRLATAIGADRTFAVVCRRSAERCSGMMSTMR